MAKIEIAVIIIAEMLAAKPSIPSVKFTALVALNMTKIVNGIKIQFGSTSEKSVKEIENWAK